MTLRKFFGTTSRAVLEQVRTELGPDALIVSNRTVGDGIEVAALAGASMNSLLATHVAAADDGVSVSLTHWARARLHADDAPVQATPATGATSATSPVNAANAASAASATNVANAANAANAAKVANAANAAPATGTPTATTAPAAATAPNAAALSTTALDAAEDACMNDPFAAALPAVGARSGTDAALAGTHAMQLRMMEEMAAMRLLLEEQVAQQSLTDALRRQPLRARMLRDLLAAGFSAALAREVTQRLPDDFSATQANAWLKSVLMRNLRCGDAEDDLVSRGGIYALVGPTGVGKTTTAAKLAARCAVRYGAAKLALLTTDSYRVGAQDQLRIYGRILGVAVHTVSDRNDMRQALDSLRGKHLVLIDTVGIGQRDQRLAEHSLLLAQPDVQRILLLNASAQAETLEEVVGAYHQPGVCNETAGPGRDGSVLGVIVTKLDEAARSAPVLDVAIRHRLPIDYVTNGQRVPEDLYSPKADYLLDRALRSSGKPSAFSFRPDELALVAGTAGAADA